MPRMVSILPASFTRITSKTPSVGDAEGAICMPPPKNWQFAMTTCCALGSSCLVWSTSTVIGFFFQPAESESHAAKPLRAIAHLLYNVSAEPGVRDVDEMPDRRAAVVALVGDAAGVQPPDQSGAEDLDRRFGVQRDAQRPPKIAAWAEGGHGERAG